MDFFNFREPVSAWTHCAGLFLALPGTFLLWRRARGDAGKRLSLLVYGLSLASCYAASTLFHGIRTTGVGISALDRLDRAGIFMLIAGTYTPLAWNLMRPRWKWGTLSIAWLLAAAAWVRLAVGGPFPPILSTSLYLAMGWGSLFCYAEVARVVSHRELRPLIVGGLCYSVGAVMNLMHWPSLWPGSFGTHDLFHLFVMAGSLAHYLLMLRVVAPHVRRPAASARRTVAMPGPVTSASLAETS